MPPPSQHPVFGRLVPDRWNQDLLTFRQFPFLRLFWRSNAHESLRQLTGQQRVWVDNWPDYVAGIARIPARRNADVYAALGARGVYEVTVNPPRKGGVPNDAQASAFDYFLKNEESICRNVIDALQRYYNFARAQSVEWFEGLPSNPTVAQLAATIDFDGVFVCRFSANGMSAVRLAWDPLWDAEHGLQMVLYRDDVIAIGTDLDEPDALCRPSLAGLWGPQQMTLAENAARAAFCQSLDVGDFESLHAEEARTDAGPKSLGPQETACARCGKTIWRSTANKYHGYCRGCAFQNGLTTGCRDEVNP
jgi:hypothetical protein